MRAFLSDCQKVETIAATIYEGLAGESAYAPWLCEVFRSLAREERDHAQAIDMVAQGSDVADDTRPGLAGMALETTVRTAEELAAGVRDGSLGEEKALRLAVHMEKQFAKVHVEHSVFTDQPRLAALFKKLRGADQLHIDRLREAIKRWKDERSG